MRNRAARSSAWSASSSLPMNAWNTCGTSSVTSSGVTRAVDHDVAVRNSVPVRLARIGAVA